MLDLVAVEGASCSELFKARVAQPLPVPGQLDASAFPRSGGEASLLHGLPPLVDQKAALALGAGAGCTEAAFEIFTARLIIW